MIDAFNERCSKCTGTKYAFQMKNINNPTEPAQQISCALCGRRTSWFCFGCRRWLCNIPRKDTKDERFPKGFIMRVPEIDVDGSFKRNHQTGRIVYKEEIGRMTCHIMAHQNQWRNDFEYQQQQNREGSS